jgi:hypothetical protein
MFLYCFIRTMYKYVFHYQLFWLIKYYKICMQIILAGNNYINKNYDKRQTKRTAYHGKDLTLR